jgi:TRAP-type mannitol/chloroaromatic compound transport system permease small subunit
VEAPLGLARAIDWFNERVGKITAWAIVVAVLVSAINAIIRKVFGTSSNAWLELQWYLFGAVFMLCASWTLKANEHIRIDIFSSRLSKRGRDWIDIFGHLLFLLPFVVVMVYLSFPFFFRSFESGEVSTNAGGLLIWPAKGLILLGFILLGLQWLSELIKRIAIMRGALEDEHASGGGHAAHAEAEAERLLQELARTDHQDTTDGGDLPGQGVR